MKRNFLLLLCIIAIIATGLASCGKKCDHTFSDEWESDATSHWHPATCEHGEIKDSLATHADANEDGFCDVCAYEAGHQHTLEAKWQFDEFNHWKNATCSHTDYKGDYALHVDLDLDSLCDNCKSHVHDINAAGYCKHTDCGKKVREVDESDISAIVNAIYVQQHLINGGESTVDFTGRSNHATGGFRSYKQEIVSYIFGANGYTYKNMSTSTTSIGNADDGSDVTETSGLQGWYQTYMGDEVFGVVSYDGGENFELDISDINKLYGWYYTLVPVADGYGAEGLLLGILNSALNPEGVYNFKSVIDTTNNIASFSCGVLVVNVSNIGEEGAPEYAYNAHYYDIFAVFTYTDDYALTSLNIICNNYTNDPGALNDGSFNKEDVGIEYDPDSETFKFVVYNAETDSYDEVTAEEALHHTHTFSFTQTVGERTAENEHPRDQFIPTGYDIYLGVDDEGTPINKFDGSSITTGVRQAVNLYIWDYTPVGTSLHYVADQVSFKLYHNGVEVTDLTSYDNQTAVAMFTFSGSLRSFFVVPKVEGAFKFEIYFMGELTHTVNINVGNVPDEYIELKDNEFAAKVTQAHEWANKVTFTANETGVYTFYLPAGVGMINADNYDSNPNGTVPYYDYNDFGNKNEDGTYVPGSFTVILSKGESISFYTMAAKKGTYVISYTFE